ncbi:hypothetical protein A3C37_03180 [Candidatus Peribacteria bacterium RIFCSPHIGHO2_02_FULL_53_20]|nr:MAG: hypothetical protein A3C37_03180 [Candidatus Peribacteria bacterium RIFCSPHIGHO2_02_FULL_53_20]OGJ67967.1 MAG: hypothetical protein A3B61_01955 [Candidatus Peribacteria bacterium RIFCSPLOWO2_01_FULL_53_10]OGJ72482.1 MAG: hypothetical protein A3G69_01230 [Candidatus Peribacteria bacterium RIFCSPLOWO2_12_FULL_53_10]
MQHRLELLSSDREVNFRSSVDGNIGEYRLRFANGKQVAFGDFVSRRNGIIRHDINASALLGCNMDCALLCVSAKQPVTILTDEQLVQQVSAALLQRNAELPSDTLRAVGFLGEGEPAANRSNILTAVRRLADSDFAVDHVVLSTTGWQYENFIPALQQTAVEIGRSGFLRLQFSLFHMDQKTRQQYIPGTQPWTEMVSVLDQFAEHAHFPVRYNVPLVQGVNDDEAHLQHLADFSAKNHSGRCIKLSSFNAPSGGQLCPVPTQQFEGISQMMRERGATVKVFIADQAVTTDGVLLHVNCGKVHAGIEHAISDVLEGARTYS